MQKHLIVIGGATATGKTATPIAVAKHFKTVILSADSRQFYKEMSIGTAKPSLEELAQVEHHFINAISIAEDYSVGDYESQAVKLLEQLFMEHDICILVGGSGLFIKAVCEGLDNFPEVPKSIVEELESQLHEQGITELQAELKRLDANYHSQVDLNNPHRLIRALSVCRASGQPFSSFRTQSPKPRLFNPIYILLELDRAVLYERINKRVDEMMEAGLLEEAKKLLPFKHFNALQTVGYQELFEYLDGNCTLAYAVEKIKQNSRRYAKRQMTWFRRDSHWIKFSPNEFENIMARLEEITGEHF